MLMACKKPGNCSGLSDIQQEVEMEKAWHSMQAAEQNYFRS
jgi:hypothetical protein